MGSSLLFLSNMRLVALIVVLSSSLTKGVNAASGSSSFWSFVRGGGGAIAVDSRPQQQPNKNQELYYTQELVVSTTPLSSSTGRRQQHSSTKLFGIIQGFQQLEVAKAPPSSSSSPMSKRRRGASPPAHHEEDIHVGKLLAAFRRMKTFLDETGMSQVAKTISTNTDKLENLYRKAPSQQRDSLMALLQYEIDLGINSNNKLQDSSGAMGLVWLGRNLSYQRDLYQLLLENPKTQPLEASQLAFEKHLQPHLHWTIAKVLQAAIRSLTPSKRSTFFATLGGGQELEEDKSSSTNYSHEESATLRDLEEILHLWQPLLQRLQRVLAEVDQLPRGLL